jgi:cystathionine beta-lyase/cystathionine gamma-synthase
MRAASWWSANTLASPAVCRPRDFGVDVVVEIATTFIGGQNDAVGGVITLNPTSCRRTVSKTGKCPRAVCI